MEELKLKHEDDEHPPMMAGVVTAYAKGLNRASGLGTLPHLHKKFPNEDFYIAYEKIIEAHNKLHAHRDTDNNFYKIKNYGNEPYAFQITISEAINTFLFTPILIDIPPARLNRVKELIALQIARLKKYLTSD